MPPAMHHMAAGMDKTSEPKWPHAQAVLAECAGPMYAILHYFHDAKSLSG